MNIKKILVQEFKQLFESPMTASTLAKTSKQGGVRGDVLAKKIKNKEPIKLIGAGEVKFDPSQNDEFLKALLRKEFNKLSKIKLVDTDGNLIPLSKLEKTSDFGGKPSGSSTHIETKALDKLNLQLSEIGPVEIKIDKKSYKDIKVGKNTPGTPKSDFELVNKEGRSVIFISHKDGSKPSHFQQYGGISLFKENKEVIRFIAEVERKVGKEMQRGGGFRRVVKDKDLLLKSVYGVDYGKDFGMNNVQILCQGDIILSKKGKGYELESNHNIYNGEIPIGGYSPYLVATFREGRNDGGIKNCRIGIYPVDNRPSAVDI